MRCTYDDCFTCPYPDCVLESKDAILKDSATREEKIEKRREYNRRYYQEHKKEIAKRVHEKYMREKHEKK